MIQVQENNLYYPFIECLSSEWSLGDRACNSLLAFSSDRMVCEYASGRDAYESGRNFQCKGANQIREHLIHTCSKLFS